VSQSIPYLGECLALLCAIIWALAVIFFRKSGEMIHPLTLNAFKNLLAFGLFLPTMWLFNEKILRLAPTSDYLMLLLSGALGLGIGDTLFLTSLNFLGAGLTGIVGCLYSPFIISLAVIMLGESLSGMQITGALLIISAILISTVKIEKGGITRRKLLIGIGCGALGTAATAFGVVLIKPLLERSPLLWATEVRLVGGVLALVLFLILYPGRGKIINSLFLTRNWLFPILGSLLGAYLAMVIWLGGMKYTQASVAAVLNQTSTIFVFIFAGIILKEPVTLRRMIGILLAFLGVLLVYFG